MWSSAPDDSSIFTKACSPVSLPGLKIIALGSFKVASSGEQMTRHLFSKYILCICPIILLTLHGLCLILIRIITQI